MTTTKVLASKLTIALVAAAMVASVFAPVAQAQTTEELQAMINDLLAQVAALQGSTEASASSASVCPYTWTRSLTAGAEGADVKTLQQFLNADADTRVAATGAGSTGLETSFFGPATAAAVSKFQVKYRADILSPANLVNPTGYFGPSTMSKANALCATAATSTEDGEDTDEDTESTDLSGEASLDTVEVDDADDSTIEEGADDAEVAEITVSFADGDASISRLDVSFSSTSVDSWDVLDTVSLWVDGDMVAEADASTKGDYLGDENDGVIRFSGLDLVAMEDEDVVITVAASIQGNIDSEDLTDFNVELETIRFFDADGVATTESEEAGEDSVLNGGTAVFTVEEAGSDDEINAKESSNDPDATTLLLQTDKKETYTAFTFNLDTDDSTNDVQVNQITITATGTTAITNYVNDAALIVDGDEVNAQDVTVNGTSIVFEFDDGDFMIEAGESVEVELSVEFDALDAGEEGDFIQFSLDGTNVDSEGADDIVGDGSASGETHVMITEGIVILADGVTTETDTSGTDDTTGIFTIEFEVTSYENDFYVATSGINFSVSGGAATTSYTLDSTGDEDSTGVFTVNDGSTETFTLTVTVDPAATGLYRVTLDSVEYSTNTNGVTGAETRTLSPASDYRTANLNINN